MIRAPVTLGTGSKCGTGDDDCVEGPTIGYEPGNRRGFQRDERESGKYVSQLASVIKHVEIPRVHIHA